MRQFFLLTRRSVVRTFRRPGDIVAALALPLILFFVIDAGLDPASKIPGFPTDNFTSFSLAVAFAQGAVLTVSYTGQDIATDVESGFLDRLSLTPVRGLLLLISELAGALVLSVIQATVFLGVGIAVGADVEAGIAGAFVLVVLFLCAAAGFGSLGIMVGLNTGSGQAVQGIAPMMLVLLFLSSFAMPRNLIETNWFRWIATVNPLSYLVEGMRSLLITGWDLEALALGFTVAVALVVLTLAASANALRGRLART